jgi:hypothetical protein
MRCGGQFRELFETGRARITDVAARVSRAVRRMSGISPQDAEVIMDYYREGLDNNRRCFHVQASCSLARADVLRDIRFDKIKKTGRMQL